MLTYNNAAMTIFYYLLGFKITEKSFHLSSFEDVVIYHLFSFDNIVI